MLNITFLGTAGSLPTPDRNPSAVLINREGKLILFDCGEGTQRQMMRARTGMMHLDYIFLSHLHADHMLGIPGLLETMAFQGRKEPLTIAGPMRTIDLVERFDSMGYYSRNFEVRASELDPGDIVRMDGYEVEAVRTDHSVQSLGFCLREDERTGRFNRDAAVAMGVPPGPLFGKLQKGQSIEINGKTITPDQVLGPKRPGRKVVYTGDTRPCKPIEDVSRDADLLIHDGALADDMIDWAMESKHSTTGEAAKLAKRAGVKKLILTHVSSRYSEDVAPLLADARRQFEHSYVAEDLMRVEIKLRDE
jgi:ribonuclease Z